MTTEGLDIEKLKKTSRKYSIKVLRATRSPMNASRWCLDLACGHEQWITSQRKPAKFAYCYICNPIGINKGREQ